jgi:hypothetical protein
VAIKAEITLRLVAGRGEHIPHQVDATTLPGRVQHIRHSSLDALMGIGDDQLDAAQAPPGELA